MQIRDMFARPIEREIKTFITVGENEAESFEQQELEEYVVTHELQKHFHDFFAAYRKGIEGTTPGMGVWITGFFGSGKSHFLKMLALLLDGRRKIAGKTALEYFRDDHKIKDPETWSDIELATQTPTDAILFDIDAKSTSDSKKDKEALVKVFNKVFDEMQGYYGELPRLADLERQLDEAGRYEEFQQRFQEKKGRTWLENRNDFFFNQDIIVSILADMGVMTEEAARNWARSATAQTTDTLSIEAFAKRVAAYLKKKGNNHHVVFLVDEITQYIDNDSHLMLNLQTIIHELGNACRGKAWVVVAGQQDIDALTKHTVKGDDFSKIQGRFNTRLTLSSANVDEVIKERILKKTEAARQTLAAVYDTHRTGLKNLIAFTGTAEKKLYRDADDFAAIYPFVGYQFDLLGKVLTAVRVHGASGKSLASGERSMLSFFQEAANAAGGEDDGALIPFSAFYQALDNFLDHSHRSVILQAYGNDHINPEHKREGDVFAVEVLKALFMVKYVQDIDANIENITSLLVSRLDEERGALRKRVQDALRLLENENLIQQKAGIYIFLTDEEQDMNRRILKQEIEPQLVTRETGEIIFEQLLPSKKYSYPAFHRRYTFSLSRAIDDMDYPVTQSGDLRLIVLTPQSDYEGEDAAAMLSGQQQAIVVRLPDRDDYDRELLTVLKIENFIKKDSEAKALAHYEEIRIIKGTEAKDRRAIATSLLKEALTDATIYICGNPYETTQKDPAKRIDAALELLVQRLYTKLAYITVPMDGDAARKMLASQSGGLVPSTSGGEANESALNDLLSFVRKKAGAHGKISRKTVRDAFNARPYGFVEDDITYLLARLYKRGDIALSIAGEYLTQANTDAKTVVDVLQKKAYLEKLMIEQREHVGEKEKKAVRSLMKELFHAMNLPEDEDALMVAFRDEAAPLLGELHTYAGRIGQHASYPGRETIATGIRLLQDTLLRERTAAGFFRAAAKMEDDLLDFHDDFEAVEAFFTGAQKGIFDQAEATYRIYRDSQNYLADPAIDAIAKQMQAILQSPRPYARIKELPALREQFNDAYGDVLEEKAAPVRQKIDACRRIVLGELAARPYEDAMKPAATRSFDGLRDKSEHSHNINELMSLENQAVALRDKYLKALEDEDAKIAAAAEAKAVAETKQGTAGTQKTTGSGAGTKPQPDTKGYRPKATAYYTMGQITTMPTVELKDAADVDRFLAALRQSLLEKLEGKDSIHITF